MSGRGSKKRGRPPKTTSESPRKFQMHLLKKPKYLQQKGFDSQLSTPSASRASSPLESEGSSRKSFPRPSTSTARTSTRGRARGRNANTSSNTSYNKRGESILCVKSFETGDFQNKIYPVR
jgi:nucleosome-remodeling factor subunit BPTF